MPYAAGRVINDADSHIMESLEWLPSYADKSIKDRLISMRLEAGGSGAASHSGVSLAGSGVSGATGCSMTASGLTAGVAAAAPFSFSSRADNCRASSLKALFSTGVRAGDFVSPGGRNGRTFFGVSTDVSRSICCEVSDAIDAGNSAVPDDATPGSAARSATGGPVAGSAATMSAENVCGTGGSLKKS